MEKLTYTGIVFPLRRKKPELQPVRQKPAALLFTTGIIWHRVTFCLILVLQHLQQ